MTALLALLAKLGLAQRLKAALPYIGCGLFVAMLCGALWWRGDHYRNQRDHEHATVLEFKAASALAEAAARKAKADAEARYQQGADHADKEHAIALSRANDATAAFIARHRLQPDSPRSTSQAVAAADRGNPELPPHPADAPVMVGISERDINACTASATYALSAFRWAQGLSDVAGH